MDHPDREAGEGDMYGNQRYRRPHGGRGRQAELGKAEHRHPRETEIIVNGRRRIIPGDEVCFEEVVELAFPGLHTDPNVIYSVTYRHAASHPSAGELGPGGKVEIRHGTIFNVTRTIKS
jgi:Multiubiquitin